MPTRGVSVVAIARCRRQSPTAIHVGIGAAADPAAVGATLADHDRSWMSSNGRRPESDGFLAKVSYLFRL